MTFDPLPKVQVIKKYIIDFKLRAPISLLEQTVRHSLAKFSESLVLHLYDFVLVCPYVLYKKLHF